MLQAIIGTKLEQSYIFNKDGKRIAVTRILTGPCRVVNIKTADKDGYNALQLGLGSRRAKTLSKPELGNLKKAGLDTHPPRFLKEIRIEMNLKRVKTDSAVSNNSSSTDENLLKPGYEIKVADVFKLDETIQITGISKGKGFQGGVKRYHFKGGPRTHGQSDRERAPGSIGQTTTPGRVYKGKRMAGRMGGDKVTIKNLKVVGIESEKNILTVSGLVPGGRNSLLIIKKIEN